MGYFHITHLNHFFFYPIYRSHHYHYHYHIYGISHTVAPAQGQLSAAPCVQWVQAKGEKHLWDKYHYHHGIIIQSSWTMGRKSPKTPSDLENRVLPGGGQQPRGVAPTEAPDAGTAGELGGLAESLGFSVRKIYEYIVMMSDPWKNMNIYGISRYFWWSMFFIVDIGDEWWILYIYTCTYRRCIGYRL